MKLVLSFNLSLTANGCLKDYLDLSLTLWCYFLVTYIFLRRTSRQQPIHLLQKLLHDHQLLLKLFRNQRNIDILELGGDQSWDQREYYHYHHRFLHKYILLYKYVHQQLLFLRYLLFLLPAFVCHGHDSTFMFIKNRGQYIRIFFIFR